VATIRKRRGKDGRTTYLVQIRLVGKPSVSKTFDRRTDAKLWAARTESEMRRNRTVGGHRTMAEAIKHYRAHQLGTLAPLHSVKRESHLMWWEERVGKVLLENFGPGHVREHLRTLEGRKVATLNRYHAAISAVLSFVVEEEWLPGNPLHGRRRRHRSLAEREEERGREVTAEEWERLRDACGRCEDPRLYALIVCAYASGARQGELLGMEWRRVELAPVVLDLETRERRTGVPRCEVVDTKNGVSRMLYFPGEAGEILRTMRSRAVLSPFVFARPGDSPDLEPRFPDHVWRHWRKRAGLDDVRFHDLRHTWACEMLDSGATLAQLMILGGWKTANMVRRYAARAQRYGSDAVEARHARMQGSRPVWLNALEADAQQV
jgi:integrase